MVSQTNYYVSCLECGGTGKAGERDCRECDGAGSGLRLGGAIAILAHNLSAKKLNQERLEHITRRWVRFFIFIFGVAGFIYLSVDTVIDISTGQSWPFQLLTKNSIGSLFFWLSVLADLYIYASLDRDLAGAKQIPGRSYHEDSQTKEQSIVFKKFPKVDIYNTTTFASKSALLDAHRLAIRLKQPLGAVHLFLTLLEHHSIQAMLARLRVDPLDLQKKLVRASVRGDLITTHDLRSVLCRAYVLGYQEGRLHLDIPLLFAAVAELDGLVKEVLHDSGIDEYKIENVLAWQQSNEQLRHRYGRLVSAGRLRPRHRLDRAMTALATPMLDFFSQDLTERAQWGYVLPTIGRPLVTDTVLRVIEGGRAPLIVGYHGVGKHGILEDIASRMIYNDVPHELHDKRLVILSLPKLVSGVSPAEAEQRIIDVLREANRSGNIVLAIEGIHGAAGITSGGMGSVDLATVLANSLKRVGVPCVASTTPADYRHYLEGTPLGTYFQVVELAEPNINEAIKIIESRIGLVEAKHEVFFSYEAVSRLIEIVDKYVTDRYLPKKAIDRLEELALFARQEKGPKHIISLSDVDQFFKTKLDIPVSSVDTTESELLLNLEDKIHERLIDQDEAVAAVSNALRRARAAQRDEKRPIVNLLFLGPTGVGKTELAKIVASLYFGSVERMIRLDMSEYQGSNSAEKLIGTQSSDGALTQAVVRSPFSLLLLDEIDKAHTDILNLFLQVMDDGRITSGKGQTIDFTNIILIATANAGSQYIQDEVLKGASLADIKAGLFATELRRSFKPEFLNRFDGMIVFKPLGREEVLQIVRLLLNRVAKRLEAQGIIFTHSDESERELAHLGFSPEFGARPLRRVIQDRVDSPLARYILEGRLKRRDHVTLGAGGELQITDAREL